MVVTLLGMVTEVRLSQYANASFPMVVTLSPMVTEVRLWNDGGGTRPAVS